MGKKKHPLRKGKTKNLALTLSPKISKWRDGFENFGGESGGGGGVEFEQAAPLGSHVHKSANFECLGVPKEMENELCERAWISHFLCCIIALMVLFCQVLVSPPLPSLALSTGFIQFT